MGTIIKFPQGKAPPAVEIIDPELKRSINGIADIHGLFREPSMDSAILDGLKSELQVALKKLVAFKGEDRATEIVGTVLAESCRT